MPSPVIAIAETSDGNIAPITYDVIAAAELLAAQAGSTVCVYALGPDIKQIARQLADTTGHPVNGFSYEADGYLHEMYCEILAAHLADCNPAYICVAHTSRGLDFAPALAARLNGTCVTGVERIRREKGAPVLYRRIQNGRQMAGISIKRTPALITIPAGIFKYQRQSAEEKSDSPPVNIQSVAIESSRVQKEGIRKAQAAAGGLKDADVIVTAGNGIGKPENIDLINRLAAIFPKSAVAGSRPVCDRKILPYSRQIGVTGAVVSPKLYIACGVSGSSQHIAGMRESGFIVSINTDARAAITNYADICIIEDLRAFIPVVLERFGATGSSERPNH